MNIDSKPGSDRDNALPVQSSVAQEQLSLPKVELSSAYTLEELTLASGGNGRVHGGIPQVKKLELRSWKDLLKLIAERDGLPFIDADNLSPASDEEIPTNPIPAFGSSAVVYDVIMVDQDEYEIIGSSPAWLPDNFSFEVDDGVSTVESNDADEVDDEAFYEHHPEMRDIDMIYDQEQKAFYLRTSGLNAHAHPRIKAAFRSAASGSGFKSCMLRASGMI